MGIFWIFGLNYSELGGRQLKPRKTFIFEGKKEDVTIICGENQTMAINSDFFEDARKQLEKFRLNFSSCNPFPS